MKEASGEAALRESLTPPRQIIDAITAGKAHSWVLLDGIDLPGISSVASSGQSRCVRVRAALPSTHSLLANFRLWHGGLEANQVAEEVRYVQLENVRFAALPLYGEREDPNVDRKVVVQGHVDPTVDTGGR
jgi:hypothetical protein